MGYALARGQTDSWALLYILSRGPWLTMCMMGHLGPWTLSSGPVSCSGKVSHGRCRDPSSSLSLSAYRLADLTCVSLACFDRLHRSPAPLACVTRLRHSLASPARTTCVLGLRDWLVRSWLASLACATLLAQLTSSTHSPSLPDVRVCVTCVLNSLT